MKNINKLALLLGLGALLPVAASATSLEQAYIDAAQRGPAVPVPISVVSPEVEWYDVGQACQVEFVVDTTGRTSGFAVKSTTDRDLAAAVVDAVKQWRFTPAQQNGVPVATRVILPVRVVSVKSAGRYAAD